MTDYARGLDVSHHQPVTLDWSRVGPEDGISFNTPRYGYGLLRDETFDYHFTQARTHGLWQGAYFFPRGDQNIDEQAVMFANLPYPVEMPLWVDVERDPRAGAVQVNAGMVRRFLEEVARITGRLPGIYTANAIWESLIGKGQTWASRYWLWIANYTDDPYPVLPDVWTDWLIWQHRVAPINSYASNIDQNVYNGTVQDIACQWRDPYADWYFQWPVKSNIVTQPFGVNASHYALLLPVPTFGNVGLGHEGIDLRAANGEDVYAAQNGVVRQVITTSSYGVNVRVDHQNGLESIYGHLQQSLVSVGNRVAIGQKIALADNTGASTGAHLHFCVKQHNATALGLTSYPSDLVNPSRWMRQPEAPGVQMRMIYTQAINIRAEATVSSNDIGDIPVDAIVMAYPPAVNDYLRILYNGIGGYALAKHFVTVEREAVLLRSTADPYVNIRAGAAKSYPDIGNLNMGETIMGFPIPGQMFWEVILPDDTTAWIASEWLEIV